MDEKPPKINEYTVNVRVQGYGLCINVKVPAKDPDEATDLACSQEFRFKDDDPYALVVVLNGDALYEQELSVLCTYETLEDAVLHVGNITSGNWMLVQRDFENEDSIVIKTSDDEII